MIKKISVVLITKNAAATLRDTLASTQDFSEVIIFDNGSDDDTSAIAMQFANVKLHSGVFSGFGVTKNKAIKLASNDWILSLDADECVNKKFIGEIESWIEQASINQLGCVLRNNYFIGRKIKYSGWNKDWIIRLFNRNHSFFNEKPVHESIVIKDDSIVYKFASPIRHNTVENINQSLQKIHQYSELAAPGIVTRNQLTHQWLVLIFFRSLTTFIKTYIFQLGALDGWRGFVIAWCNANGVFFKYLKAYISYRQNRDKYPSR